MIPPEKIRQYLKVYALAKRGSTEGEKQSAQSILQAMEGKFPGIEKAAFPPKVITPQIRKQYTYKTLRMQYTYKTPSMTAEFEGLNEVFRAFNEQLLRVQTAENARRKKEYEAAEAGRVRREKAERERRLEEILKKRKEELEKKLNLKIHRQIKIKKIAIGVISSLIVANLVMFLYWFL